MAIFVVSNPVITVNSVDMSDHCDSVTVATEREEVEATAFGATNKVTLAGLGDATITANFHGDFAAGETDATLWPLSSTTTPFTVTVKHTSAATSATNPLFSMSALLFSYSPIDAAMGELSTTEVTFKNAAQAGLTRATS